MAKILIVDDEEMDRVVESSILEGAGHELMFAPHGETALRLFKSQLVDLVITDLAMPELNGLRLIQELRRLDPAVRIIAISGVSAHQLERAAALGAARTLQKPVAPEDLLKAVDEAMTKVIFKGDRWQL